MLYGQIKNNTLAERIAQNLREKIIQGNYQAGEHLTISEISKEYNVSNTPVREALRILEGEYFVSIDPYRGAIVEEIGRQFIQDMYNVEGALAFLLVEDACNYITAEKIEEMSQINLKMAEMVQSQELGQSFSVLNQKFHNTFYACSTNASALSIYDYYHGLTVAFRKIHPRTQSRAWEIISEHQDILNALRAKNYEQVLALEKKHHKAAMAAILEDFEL